MTKKIPFYQAKNDWVIWNKIKFQMLKDNPEANIDSLQARIDALEVELIKLPGKFSDEADPRNLDFKQRSRAFKKEAQELITSLKKDLEDEKAKAKI